ncbi:hypothetical protein DNTS_013896 [Danionella cerebrum]|uniref:Uncharacterized protein n=1 Tax=Danionella cerebrum TaxID=2873325 RepID=A0A553QBW2_9TELE|nr:hypothetical protein DNTS_013896 [Danionella translucida]
MTQDGQSAGPSADNSSSDTDRVEKPRQKLGTDSAISSCVRPSEGTEEEVYSPKSLGYKSPHSTGTGSNNRPSSVAFPFEGANDGVIAYYLSEFNVPESQVFAVDEAIAKMDESKVSERKTSRLFGHKTDNNLIIDGMTSGAVDARLADRNLRRSKKKSYHAHGNQIDSIHSPGFYDYSYSPNLYSEYQIRADPEHRIKLEFDILELERDCHNDFIKVYDSLVPSEKQVITEKCGFRLPNEKLIFISSGNVMLVTLVTNEEKNFPGFRAFYSQIPAKIPDCGGTLTGLSGTFSSPGYPAHYPPQIECIWNIEVPPGKHIRVKFDKFSVHNPEQNTINCPTDYLELNYRICGKKTENTVYTIKSNQATVRFHSDQGQVAEGFYAQFEAFEHINPCPRNFACDNDLCIPSHLLCDGYDNCGDMSDERGCLCNDTQIKCKNGFCKPAFWRCDGVNDCLDNTDEENCAITVSCSHHTYKCKNNKCISKINPMCDGEADCEDGSDEAQCKCGSKPISGRIVGGKNSDDGEWPWQVSLHIKTIGHVCGATIINNLWLVTAAHCVQDDEEFQFSQPDQWKVYLGLHNQEETSKSTERHVKRIIPHPKYNHSNYDNDIALMELDSPVTLSKKIWPVCLPEATHDFPTGKSVWITGWGKLRAESDALPSVLQKAEVRIINSAVCNTLLAHGITPRMICAGVLTGGVDACQGDSGGPMTSIESNGHMFLAGVVSWGEGCGRRNKPGVYTRVTEYRSWIRDITDPLESRIDRDGCVMEECLLGNCRVRVPEDLLEDPEIFFSVLNESTWTDVLTDDQRSHLRQFLPQFPENSVGEQNTVIRDLFNNQNFLFGNPLHIAQKLFRDGHFNPEVVKYRQLCAKSLKKRQIFSRQQYYHKLLKQILISRKELLDLAARSGPDLAIKRHYPVPSHKEMLEQRVRHRVGRILKDVKSECGDSNVSSDEEDTASWMPVPQSPTSPTTTVSLRVLPSLSTQDMKTREKPELGEKELKAMLHRHREKRKRQPDHPDLMTADLHLGDVMSRVNIGRKGSVMSLFDLAQPKKKIKEERKKKKMRPVKMESEELYDAPISTPSINSGLADVLAAPPVVKEEPMEESQTSPDTVEEIALSFFHLLEDVFRLENVATSSMVEEKVQQWQVSPASTLNPWFSMAPCWSELVVPALQFLAGESKGSTQDGDKDLNALCQLWLETKDNVVVKQEGEESAELTPPTPRVWTDYVVRPSTGEERHVFQEQEQQRYDQPHKAFTYRMHGFESVVGPVKGVFDKETSLNKAREHSLLRSDRPAYVTILSLVRDAAARLPNGEGTRAEICELLKDSQFLAPDVTSAQVNTVVSGALDRLHYEKDPCVKYDIGRKLWIYLHRDRSQEEFERIHQAQAAAAKAKKAQQQKPKPATKPKAGGKEPASKNGSSEGSGNETAIATASLPQAPSTPTPSTPGTPKSPLPPTAVTPTKPVAPEAVKPNPSMLLVSPPAMPQIGALLSSSQPGPQVSQQASPQHATRVVAHSAAASSLPQVRVVTSQSGLQMSPAGQTPALVHQSSHHIRVPVTVAHGKNLTQAVVTLPIRSQSTGSPIQVQASRGQTCLTVPGLTSAVTVTKPQSCSPSSPAHNPAPAVLQGVAGQNIIKQVAITGQLGVKAQSGAGIPLGATNLRIQGKDVLRLPPSSITTDAKGQTVLRITPDMMATLTKSPVTTVKLTPDMLSTATSSGGKSISATLHVSPTQPSPPATNTTVTPTAETLAAKASAQGTATLVKAACDTAIRLMPALAVTMADPKACTFSTVTSSDSKAGTTIRIVPNLGVIPHKQGQTLSISTTTTSTKPITVSSGAATVTIATSGVGGSKGVTLGPAVTGSGLSLGTAAATVRQVPVSATVVTTQASKLPTRITVPLSVLSQPLKNKSVVTTPILKGNISTNISSLGRNIILTTMPAGTKLIAGNKPVSFVTAQQLQQLQQQGQATQVRIQTVPAPQLQRTATSSPKSTVSTVLVSTAASPKTNPDPQS